MTEFDIAALEKALSGKERKKKEPQKTKGRRSDKPLFVVVDKSYGLKQND